MTINIDWWSMTVMDLTSSTSATLTVIPRTSIVLDPNDTTGCEGGEVFMVAGVSGGDSVRWEEAVGASWVPFD